MMHLHSKLVRPLTVGLGILLLVISSAALAQGNSAGKANGKNKNIGVGNASDGLMGRISTNKSIAYTGQPLEISLRFARGAELVTDGDVDAYVVIFAPNPEENAGSDSPDDSGDDSNGDSNDGTGDNPDTDALTDAIVLPVSDVASEDSQKLFELEAVDISELPAGTYQLGLILTDPGGDPLSINDWHQGLLGLVHVIGLTISDEALDFDEDMDGEVDDDSDGDGFSDDDEPDDDSDEDSDSDSGSDPDTGDSSTS